MKRLIAFALVLTVAACGSTGTDSSGSSDDDDDGSSGFTCASFTAGPGIICDNSTNPPTIRADIGTGAGQVAAGDDPRLAAIADKGKYLMSFTPTVGTEAIAGMLIKNAATGRIGLRAADELCKLKNAAYPYAHMCTMDEVQANVGLGLITGGATGIAVGFDADPGLGGAANSFKGTCGGLTYNSQDLLYLGSRWTVTASDSKNQADGDVGNDNLAAPALNVERGLACNTTAVPIACCQ